MAGKTRITRKKQDSRAKVQPISETKKQVKTSKNKQNDAKNTISTAKQGNKEEQVKITSKSSCFSQHNNCFLTPAETQVFHLLTKDFLTPRQIQIRRRCSQQAISQVISNLKKKGFLNPAYSTNINLVNSVCTPQANPKNNKILPKHSSNHLIRLHGIELHVNLIHRDERYKQLRAKSNLLNIDGDTIRLYNDAIEIYIEKSFFGEDTNHATRKAMQYVTKCMTRLENDLKVLLLKSRYQNIRVVKHHYAEISNEYGQDCELKGTKLNIHTKDDGKLWFLIDNSYNLHEAETVHPETAKPDMEKVVSHFNDIRDNQHIPLSQVSQFMADTTKQVNEIAHGLNSVIMFLNSQIPKEPKQGKDVIPDYLG